jgi:hypothetical protein
MPRLFGLQAPSKLARQHEGDLATADFAGQLNSRQILDRVDEQEDRREQLAEAHLAVGQVRSGGDAERVAAAFADPLASCRSSHPDYRTILIQLNREEETASLLQPLC